MFTFTNQYKRITFNDANELRLFLIDYSGVSDRNCQLQRLMTWTVTAKKGEIITFPYCTVRKV